MSDLLLRVENLSFGFPGHVPLFENLSFSVEKGSCLGISGPSGCGKSTLAQILAGHMRAKSGRVFVGEPEIVKPGRRVFLVHQDADLFPWLTVRKQIEFCMEQPDFGESESLIALTKLNGFENHYPHQLSGGMKKRLSIARALAAEPRVIIFDESFSSLDFELRMELFKDLKEIWRTTHTTILLISHDPRDLEQMAQSELYLGKKGARGVASGTRPPPPR